MRPLSILPGKVLVDGLEATFQAGGLRVDEVDAQTRHQAGGGNAGAHGAGTQHGHLTDGAPRRIGFHARHLGGGALGEEGMAQRCTLRAAHEGLEPGALGRQAIGKRAVDAGRHRLHAFARRRVGQGGGPRPRGLQQGRLRRHRALAEPGGAADLRGKGQGTLDEFGGRHAGIDQGLPRPLGQGAKPFRGCRC
jgi:hypothetical protein